MFSTPNVPNYSSHHVIYPYPLFTIPYLSVSHFVLLTKFPSSTISSHFAAHGLHSFFCSRCPTYTLAPLSRHLALPLRSAPWVPRAGAGRCVPSVERPYGWADWCWDNVSTLLYAPHHKSTSEDTSSATYCTCIIRIRKCHGVSQR